MVAEVIRGDCLPTLRGMASDSIDAIVTDPPYALTSGHYRDDKRANGGFMGAKWDATLPDPAIWRECLRVLKPGASALVMSGSRLDCLWRMCRDLEAAGFELQQSALYWVTRSGFPKGQNLSIAADHAAGAERDVIRMTNPSDPRESGRGGGSGFETRKLESIAITAPSSPLAVALDGWFTKGKVKPAVEVIIWARKPISEKTELANMAKWGVGGVNCGACMVPYRDGDDAGDPDRFHGTDGGAFLASDPAKTTVGTAGGRYPSNLLCTDNEALGEGARYFSVDAWAREHGFTEDGWTEAAMGGVLQVPKPSRAEKNAGCEGLPEKSKPLMGEWGDNPGRETPKQSDTPRANFHPTCKPVRLFAYLAEFLCPRGGTVLDPFAGSGATGVACVQTGRSFIGCELSEEYASIADARIAAAQASQRSAQLRIAV